MTVRKSVALTQWTIRSVRSNRGKRSSVSDGFVVATIAVTDPRVDVVAEVLPVAGDDFRGRVDAVEPLDRLVAVHRRDVEPYGTAVLGGDVVAEHLVRDHHVVATRLLEGQALRVRAVEGR